MIIISFSLLGIPPPSFLSALRGIAHSGFLSSLFCGTMSVSLVLLTLRANQTEQALVGFTKDHLCLLVGPTKVFLTLQELPEIGFSDSGHQSLQKNTGFEVCLFWSLSTPGQLAGTSACSQKRQRQDLQKLCPQTMVTGSRRKFRQMRQVNSFWKASWISESIFLREEYQEFIPLSPRHKGTSKLDLEDDSTEELCWEQKRLEFALTQMENWDTKRALKSCRKFSRPPNKQYLLPAPFSST